MATMHPYHDDDDDDDDSWLKEHKQKFQPSRETPEASPCDPTNTPSNQSRTQPTTQPTNPNLTTCGGCKRPTPQQTMKNGLCIPCQMNAAWDKTED